MIRDRGSLPYLLVAPVLVCGLVVHVAPTVVGVILSFLRIGQTNLGHWTSAPSAGTGNYHRALDPSTALGSALWTSWWVTLAFTAIVVGLSWLLGIFAAAMLSVPMRGSGLVRTLFLIPLLIPTFASTIGWRFLFSQDTGAVNHLLVDNLHLAANRPSWLVDHAFWAMVITAVWHLWPLAFVMLGGALSTVPRSRYEAAAQLGGNAWSQFRVVALPHISRVNRVVVVILALWTFNEFTVPWVLFAGAPPQSGTLLSTLVYREAFGTFDIGLAAATNVMITVVLLVLGLLYLRRGVVREESA